MVTVRYSTGEVIKDVSEPVWRVNDTQQCFYKKERGSRHDRTDEYSATDGKDSNGRRETMHEPRKT